MPFWKNASRISGSLPADRDKWSMVNGKRLIDNYIRRRRIMPKYEIILYWSEEDQVFVAEVPELPGCMAHGDTEETALNK